MIRNFVVAVVLALTPAFGALTSVTLAIGELRDASGQVIADGGGAWAVIVAGQPGNPPTVGALPGGLTDLSSLTALNKEQILSDFANQSLAVGSSVGGGYVAAVGAFDSVISGGVGIIAQVIAFEVYDPPVNGGFAANSLFGVYWFPGTALSEGAIELGVSFEVGGFASSTANFASNGEWGTTVPSAGNSSVQFFETGFWQGIGGEDTGLDPSRFTAVLVPEPATFALSALGLAALFRRRR